MNKYHLKEVKKRDEKLVCELLQVWQKSVEATHLFLTEKDVYELIPYVKMGIMGIETLIIVQSQDTKVVGFMGIEKEKIEMLFLHPDFFRRGIGTGLVNYAIRKCKVTSVDVNEQNPQAYEFYLSVGFKVESRSELDEQGRAFPILHLKLEEQSC